MWRRLNECRLCRLGEEDEKAPDKMSDSFGLARSPNPTLKCSAPLSLALLSKGQIPRFKARLSWIQGTEQTYFRLMVEMSTRQRNRTIQCRTVTVGFVVFNTANGEFDRAPTACLAKNISNHHVPDCERAAEGLTRAFLVCCIYRVVEWTGRSADERSLARLSLRRSIIAPSATLRVNHGRC